MLNQIIMWSFILIGAILGAYILMDICDRFEYLVNKNGNQSYEDYLASCSIEED